MEERLAANRVTGGIPRSRLDDSEAESLRAAFQLSKVADAFNHDVIQRIGEIISRAMVIRPRW